LVTRAEFCRPGIFNFFGNLFYAWQATGWRESPAVRRGRIPSHQNSDDFCLHHLIMVAGLRAYVVMQSAWHIGIFCKSGQRVRYQTASAFCGDWAAAHDTACGSAFLRGRSRHGVPRVGLYLSS